MEHTWKHSEFLVSAPSNGKFIKCNKKYYMHMREMAQTWCETAHFLEISLNSITYLIWICFVHYTGTPETPDGFWNIKTSLPATRCFHIDSHHAQCCLEFNWHGNVSICDNKFFHFALKRCFISKTVRCFWSTLYTIGRSINSLCLEMQLSYQFSQRVKWWSYKTNLNHQGTICLNK
jgi:hypothetical protein